uniref:CX domain-containing protein n=1 Tax=Parascaris univalens TaxID=6257 RepID=A0A915CH54_PARUN
MFQAFFLCTLLLIWSIDARKVKVGSPPRGVSAARAGSGAQPRGNVPQGGFAPHQQPGGFQGSPGVYPNQQGGFRPAQPGGFVPNQPSGFHPNQPGGFHTNQGFAHPGFNTGTGPGSVSRGSHFKTALAAGALGAVGGIVTYELGKAIIHSATEPFHVNNRPYYFDDRNYQQKNGYSMCSMPLEELIKQTQASTTTVPPAGAEATGASGNESAQTTTPSPDQLLANIQFKDGSKPKTIVWGCKTGSEVCCGTECCPAPAQPTGSANGSSRGSSFAGIAFGVLVYWWRYSF